MLQKQEVEGLIDTNDFFLCVWMTEKNAIFSATCIKIDLTYFIRILPIKFGANLCHRNMHIKDYKYLEIRVENVT